MPGGEGKNRKLRAEDHEGTFLGWWKWSIYIDNGGCYSGIYMCQSRGTVHLTVRLKYVCKLYLKEVDFFKAVSNEWMEGKSINKHSK